MLRHKHMLNGATPGTTCVVLCLTKAATLIVVFIPICPDKGEAAKCATSPSPPLCVCVCVSFYYVLF